MHAAGGAEIAVDDRGELSAVPVEFAAPGGAPGAVSAWAGPWPITERWWDGGRRVNRFQLVDEAGGAWLLVLDDSGWWAEARYD